MKKKLWILALVVLVVGCSSPPRLKANCGTSPACYSPPAHVGPRPGCLPRECLPRECRKIP